MRAMEARTRPPASGRRGYRLMWEDGRADSSQSTAAERKTPLPAGRGVFDLAGL